MIKIKLGVESQTISSGIQALAKIEEIIKNQISLYKKKL